MIRTNYITTYTGRKFSIFDPQPEDICIEDIAHALSLTCRFGGHVKKFYSVAKHSIALTEYFDGCWIEQRQALLHDASEAYLTDVPTPFKEILNDYNELESKVLRVIFDKFGVPYPLCQEVDRADKDIAKYEAKTLFIEAPDWAQDVDEEGSLFKYYVKSYEIPNKTEGEYLLWAERLVKS